VSAPDENAPIHLCLLELVEGQRMAKPQRDFKAGQPIVRCSVQTGDHLLVNRITYNFRQPKRGETIVFRSEEHPGMTPNTHYIKRLIALPGDRVRIGDDRHVYINDRRLEATEPGFENVYSFDPSKPPHSDQYSGHLNGTIWTKHFGQPGPTANFPDQKTEVTIRPGHYLTFGDNTLNSADSRDWPEPDFPVTQVVGKESFVFWPFSERWGSKRN
jgi:signal peptidase I